MKKNTEQAKTYLMQALQNMPEDFALSDARYHIKAALQKVEHVERKRDRREVVQQQNQMLDSLAAPGQYIDPEKMIGTIDQMIEDEKKKLNEIRNRKQKRAAIDDIDDIQTIFG